MERDGTNCLQELCAAAQGERPHYNWVGFYIVEGDELVPARSSARPAPHARIPIGKGICGAAVASGRR
jgi:GAF domain-containing protein